jgi:hypothetical protein
MMKKYFITAIIGLAFFSGSSFANNENILNPKVACDECTQFGCYCAGMPHNCCTWCEIPHCSKDMTSSTQTKTP